MQYGFRIASVWLVKLVTDPITDVYAYHPAAVNVWTTKDWKTATWENFQSHLRGGTAKDGGAKSAVEKKTQ
jgi:hypothetical protein